jgi:hypothetical protein
MLPWTLQFTTFALKVRYHGDSVFGSVNSISFIWNDNMREKREANANATWRALIRDRPRGDGV